MWYVIYCRGREEESIIESCKQRISKDILKDAFQFTYSREEKWQGEWKIIVKKMFPGYIFLSTDNEEALYNELRQYKDFVTIMEDKEVLIPVRKEEERRLTVLCGKAHHLGMSRGVIRDGVTIVSDGPLKGLESIIKRIDRHKRLATIEIDMPGDMCKELKVGLEITEKC